MNSKRKTTNLILEYLQYIVFEELPYLTLKTINFPSKSSRRALNTVLSVHSFILVKQNASFSLIEKLNLWMHYKSVWL